MKLRRCLYLYWTDEKAEAQEEAVMCVPKVPSNTATKQGLEPGS